jgi:hypothetical protein
VFIVEPRFDGSSERLAHAGRTARSWRSSTRKARYAWSGRTRDESGALLVFDVDAAEIDKLIWPLTRTTRRKAPRWCAARSRRRCSPDLGAKPALGVKPEEITDVTRGEHLEA